MKFATIILAGGEGRRIGGGKPLRMLAGKTLIDRAIERAREWSPVLAISVRNPQQVGRSDFSIIEDAPDLEGPLAGLAAALRFARAEGWEAVLTSPADMPFLPANFADRLSASIEGRCSAVAASGSRLHPVCGLWRVAALEKLPDYLSTGRRSLLGFADAVGVAAVSWETQPVDPFFNINSYEDLKTAERILQR